MRFRAGAYDYLVNQTATGAEYSATNGQQSASVALSWVFGDQQFGDTFLYQQNRIYFESRVSYRSSACRMFLLAAIRRKHDFAFAGLLSCAHDGCTITTELHKGKYVYYRCSYGRDRCDLPYMPESRLSNQLGSILKNIYVPEHVVTAIVKSMSGDQARAQEQRAAQITSAQQRLSALRTRMDQAY